MIPKKTYEPRKRRKFKGLKIPRESPEILKKQEELNQLERTLNGWVKTGQEDDPIFVEQAEDLLSIFLRAFPKMSNKGPIFGGRHFDTIIMDDLFNDPVASNTRSPEWEWQSILKSLPNLEGQIIGGHTIVWGHKVSFKKFMQPILSKYGDILSENAGMRATCTCGWDKPDILPEIKIAKQDGFNGPIIYQPDFQLLEKLILNHISGVFEEVEYTVLSQEWFEDIGQPGYLLALMKLLRDSGAIVQHNFDTRNYVIVDDKMSDADVAKLAEMLEGHPVGSRKVRVLRNG